MTPKKNIPENIMRILRSVICQSCYWASPMNYAHVAMRDIRRLEMVWQGNEARQYDKVKKMADTAEEDMPAFVKKLLRRITGKRS